MGSQIIDFHLKSFYCPAVYALVLIDFTHWLASSLPLTVSTVNKADLFIALLSRSVTASAHLHTASRLVPMKNIQFAPIDEPTVGADADCQFDSRLPHTIGARSIDSGKLTKSTARDPRLVARGKGKGIGK